MHIAIVSPYPLKNPKGGVEAAAANLVRELSKDSALRLTVVAPSYGSHTHVERRGAVTIHWVRQPALGFLSYWSVLKSRVHQVLSDIQPDVVHFEAMLALGYGYKGPSIATVHGIGEREIVMRGGRGAAMRAKIVGWAENRARRQVRDCIVINPYVADLLADPLKGAALHHIGNPLDPAFFEAHPPVVRNQDVLFVAKMDRNKNLRAAIDAFALAAPRLPEDARLVCYGPVADEGYHAECLAALASHGLQPRVVFQGAQPPSVIAAHMRSARGLLLTSHHEVAPMVISEALSCGLPTVTYRKCGMQYMVEHERTGFLVDDGDIAGLANGLVFVSGAEDMERQCRNAGQYYSPTHVAAETLALYQSVVNCHA